MSRDNIELLRAFVRYRTHGGYVWAAVMADGELLCERCALANYRQIFVATRDGVNDEWRVVGLTNSGESEGIEQCCHCHRVLWDNEAVDSINS